MAYRTQRPFGSTLSANLGERFRLQFIKGNEHFQKQLNDCFNAIIHKDHDQDRHRGIRQILLKLDVLIGGEEYVKGCSREGKKVAVLRLSLCLIKKGQHVRWPSTSGTTG